MRIALLVLRPDSERLRPGSVLEVRLYGGPTAALPVHPGRMRQLSVWNRSASRRVPAVTQVFAPVYWALARRLLASVVR